MITIYILLLSLLLLLLLLYYIILYHTQCIHMEDYTHSQIDGRVNP